MSLKLLLFFIRSISFVFLSSTLVTVARSSDSTISVEKYPGTNIEKQFENRLVQYKIATGPIDEESPNLIKLEAKQEYTMMSGPKDASILEVYRVLQATIKENNFSTIYTCKNEDCGGDLIAHLVQTSSQKHYSNVRYDGQSIMIFTI